MHAVVLSNLAGVTAFFDKLFEIHRRKNNSAFVREKVGWSIKLINTATTTLKTGGSFSYYDVVDKGRASINRGIGKFIAFAGQDGGKKILTKGVKAAQGYNITQRSLARVVPEYSAQLIETLNQWLDNASEDELLVQARVNNRFTKRNVRLPGFRSFRVGRARHVGNEESSTGAELDERGRPIKNRNDEDDDDDDASRFLNRAGVLFAGNSPFTVDDTSVPLIPEATIGGLTALQQTRLGDPGGKEVGDNAKRSARQVARNLLKKSKVKFDDKQMLREAKAAQLKADNTEKAKVIAAFRSMQQAGTSRGAEQSRLLGLQSTKGAEQSFRLASGPIPSSFRLPTELEFAKFSPEAISGGIGPGALRQAQGAFVRKLSKLPNWYAIAAIFDQTAVDQVDTFIVHTPSRKETKNFKMVYGAGGLTALPPSTGGSLRNSYKLLSSSEFEKQIED